MVQDEVKDILEIFMSMKKDACRKNKGPTDLQPMLHFKGKDSIRHAALLVGHSSETVSSAWQQMLRHVNPECVVMMTEGYCHTFKKLPEKHEKGSFEREYKEDPCSNVQEILTVHGIDIKTGAQFGGFVTFIISDDGQPEFEKPHFNTIEGEALECNIPTMFAVLREATLESSLKGY